MPFTQRGCGKYCEENPGGVGGRFELKRVDIKTGFSCNNNCIFCVQADNKPLGNRSFEEIKENLVSSKERCDGVILTGGEVTIRKDFLKILKLAKGLGYTMIQIQSNGRKFSSLDFCREVIGAGATEFGISLHGYCAEQHDYLTTVKGSFMQAARGIRNLKSLGACVMTNSVVVESNYMTLPLLSTLLVKLNVDQIQFAFVHALGNARKNFDQVVPSMSLASSYIHKALQVAANSGKFARVEAIPYCQMKGYEQYVVEKFIPDTEVRGVEYQNTDDSGFQRQNFSKMKFVQCSRCRYDPICEGPWKEYPEKRGNKEFVPVSKRVGAA